MLYTALTRQRNRVVVLHQGRVADLHRFSHDAFSETAKRPHKSFGKPKPVAIKVPGQAVPTFLEEKLIHRTMRGEAVRSKSEVIIADHLANRGLVYRYEAPLTLGGETRFPDFTVEDSDTGVLLLGTLRHVLRCWLSQNGGKPNCTGIASTKSFRVRGRRDRMAVWSSRRTMLLEEFPQPILRRL